MIPLLKNTLSLVLFLPLLMACTACSNNDNWYQAPVIEEPIIEEPVVINDPVTPISDEDALNLVQSESIKYFWDLAEPNSKLARERYIVNSPSTDAQIVTTGGSGFGLMSLIVGVERGFISRNEAVSRLTTALNFLENADRFHGAWPHWLDGNTGNVIPFSQNDNGGDLVETAFLCQGLITVREYFKDGNTEEQALANQANLLWEGVEWSWYTKGENVLYWHWSPNLEWIMNFPLRGFDETLITYILAKASPTFPISNEVYEQGWARNGDIVNNQSRYDIPLVFKHNGVPANNVGPMFWSQYSFLGLDPRGLTDQYADYWSLTQNHAKIQLEYCKANPSNFTDYSDKCWGLTASYTRNSDGTTGYTDHKPTNDRGVITPTAALSNFPYTPVESMKFLKYIYQEHRARYVGVAGPYDAIAPHFIWKTESYLAIDQGTIAPMIENYRTGLLWNLFMNAPDVRTGLQDLGFSSTQHGF